MFCITLQPSHILSVLLTLLLNCIVSYGTGVDNNAGDGIVVQSSLRSGGAIVDNASILGEGGGVDAWGGEGSKSGDVTVPGGSGDETKAKGMDVSSHYLFYK